MKKTLIAYGTRKGATADTAAVIAKVLRDKFSLIVDVVNIKETNGSFDLGEYQNIIIG